MRSLAIACVLALCFTCGLMRKGTAAERLTVYVSIKESLVGRLHDVFLKKYPGIILNYRAGGAGELIDVITEEQANGKILADVLWILEVPYFYKLKDAGLLEKYISPAMPETLNPFSDFDGSFTAVRLGIIGITYNTRLVKSPPTAWSDLAKPMYKNKVSIATPAASGAAYLGVVMLSQQFGWDYFKQLHANGAKVGAGAIQVIRETASGDTMACLGVDYITYDKTSRGASLAIVFPQEMIMIPHSIAIIKGTSNLEAAQKFIDFMLSHEAQTIMASEGALPLRSDIPIPPERNLPSPDMALQSAIKVNYKELGNKKEEILNTFFDIMRDKK